MIHRAFAALLILPFAGPVLAEGFSLSLPLDCDLGSTCRIQQYVDRDPGPGAQDYRCAELSYDGHKGTDFAIPTLKDIEDGVVVRAIAPGRVMGARDGMPDTGYSPATAAGLVGRECGNGVRIDHGEGWQTQYCHMRRGSVSVSAGDIVDAGTALGHVGQSGKAEFPHLHFSVTRHGEVIDPFAPDQRAGCFLNGTGDDPGLWTEMPAYRSGGLIAVGLMDSIPDYADVKAGTVARDSLPADAPSLVVYGYMFGTRVGDRLHLSIEGPEGTVLSHDMKLEDQHALSFQARGLRGHGLWPSGQYKGYATLYRGDRMLGSLATDLKIP